MYHPDELFKNMQAIKYKEFSFVSIVTRNNSRNKELCFILKGYTPMQQHDTYSWGKTARIFIEIDAVLDTSTGKTKWNYVLPAMQQTASQILIDTAHRQYLHQRLEDIFDGPNKLKIETSDLQSINDLL